MIISDFILSFLERAHSNILMMLLMMYAYAAKSNTIITISYISSIGLLEAMSP